MDGIELLVWIGFLAVGMSVGIALSDQATLRDCATKGEAKMTSGGTIECTVKKESK